MSNAEQATPLSGLSRLWRDRAKELHDRAETGESWIYDLESMSIAIKGCATALDKSMAAASADTERLVRAAVEATIGAAMEQVDYDYAIDIDAIVARVMQSQ